MYPPTHLSLFPHRPLKRHGASRGVRYGRYTWTEIFPLDHFSRGEGPGRRWKFSLVTDGLSMVLFGGQTLWDGLLPENRGSGAGAATDGGGSGGGSGGGPNGTAGGAGGGGGGGFEAADLSHGLQGGFLKDMWVFRKRPLTRGWAGMNDYMVDVPAAWPRGANRLHDNDDGTPSYSGFRDGGGADPENYASTWEENPLDSGDFGGWHRVNQTEECWDRPGERWADRAEGYCRVFWPEERAGHVMVLDATRNGLWLHGGFRTHYPYHSTEDLAKVRPPQTRARARFHTHTHTVASSRSCLPSRRVKNTSPRPAGARS